MPPTSSTESSSTPRPANRVRLTLSINGADYLARPLPPAELPNGSARGFRLTRDDDRRGRVAHAIAVGREGLSCSCPDQQYRRSHGATCKHLAAAQAVGLL